MFIFTVHLLKREIKTANDLALWQFSLVTSMLYALVKYLNVQRSGK